MIELRDYQQDAIAEIDALWPSTQAIILQMPTGAGKTITAASWLREILRRHPGTVVGWLVHTGHLRSQAAEAFDEVGVAWEDWSTVKANQRRWEPGRVHCFGSTMTLPPGPHPTETVLVVDECHRSASYTYAKEMDRRRGHGRRHRRWRRRLGLSATPARYGWPDTISDSQRLFARQWDAMVRGPSPAELVEAGHLADVTVMSIDEAGGDWELLVPDATRASGFSSKSEQRWERTLSVDAAVAIIKRMEPRPDGLVLRVGASRRAGHETTGSVKRQDSRHHTEGEAPTVARRFLHGCPRPSGDRAGAVGRHRHPRGEAHRPDGPFMFNSAAIAGIGARKPPAGTDATL